MGKYKIHTTKRSHKSGKLSKVFRTSQGKPDYFLVSLFGVLMIFGLLMLSSASSVQAFNRYDNAYYFAWRQITHGLLPGILLLIFFSYYNYQKLEKYTLWFFAISVVLLVSVFIPGIGAEYNNARSWISIAGLSFQPAEIVKLLMVLAMSGWFAHRGREMNKDFWNGLVPFTAILGIVSLLVIAQPDMGTLVVIAMLAVVIYFIAGAKLSHLFSLGLLGVLAFGIFVIQAPYRAARFMTFLNPELDPLGIGYHINQALLAIGSGGWFGLGFGQSRQKFAYLPEVMGDSIYAVIAEELGFVVAISVIILFVLLAWRCLIMLKNAKDEYTKYIIAGITAWLCFQSFFNIGAMLGLLPLTGIPLPFISYGGTALAMNLAAAGILINISKHVKMS